jgi:hypothetical protein
LQFLGSDGGGKRGQQFKILTSTWVEFQIVLSLREKYVLRKKLKASWNPWQGLLNKSPSEAGEGRTKREDPSQGKKCKNPKVGGKGKLKSDLLTMLILTVLGASTLCQWVDPIGWFFSVHMSNSGEGRGVGGEWQHMEGWRERCFFTLAIFLHSSQSADFASFLFFVGTVYIWDLYVVSSSSILATHTTEECLFQVWRAAAAAAAAATMLYSLLHPCTHVFVLGNGQGPALYCWVRCQSEAIRVS